MPDNWVLSTVGDVFQINPKNKVGDSIDSGFVPMASIKEGYSNSFSFDVKPWNKIKNGFTHFADGDIAVAKISPCLENRKSMVLRNLPNGIGAGTTELLVFRSKAVIPEFGLLFFNSDHFISQCIGTFNGVVGQQRVSKNIVEPIYFPVPPKVVQLKIIGTVKKIFKILDSIEVNLNS